MFSTSLLFALSLFYIYEKISNRILGNLNANFKKIVQYTIASSQHFPYSFVVLS